MYCGPNRVPDRCEVPPSKGAPRMTTSAPAYVDGSAQSLDKHWGSKAMVDNDGFLTQGVTSTDKFGDFTAHLGTAGKADQRHAGIFHQCTPRRRAAGEYHNAPYEIWPTDSLAADYHCRVPLEVAVPMALPWPSPDRSVLSLAMSQ